MAGHSPIDWGDMPAAPAVAPPDPNSPVGWGDTPATLPPWYEDVAKTAIPSTVRGGVAAVTGIPSMIDLAAKGVGAGANKLQPDYISPETAKTIQSGAEAVQNKLAPVTYGGVMKDIEEGVPSVGFKGTGPLYEPKTRAGKVLGTGLEIAPSAFTGATGVIPKLGRPVERIVRSLMGGAGATAGGELAENYLPDWAKPWAQATGGIIGAAAGPAAGRRVITGFPSTTEHAADVATLKDAGIKGMSAAQVTGSPRLGQLEANLAGPSLAGKDAASFTQAAAARAGMPGVTSLTPEAFKKADASFKAYNDTVKKSEIQPPNFANMHQEISGIRADAFKAMHGDVNENIDPIIKELQGGPGALSMRGDRYQYLRQKLSGLLGSNDITGKEKYYLGQIKDSLDAAMEKELPTSLADQHKAYANFEVLKNTKDLDKNRQLTPEILKKSIINQWGPDAYNMGRGMSDLASAGERVMTRPAANTEPSKIVQALSTAAGGGAGEAISPSEMLVGMIAGKEMAPLVSGAGRVVGRAAYFNPLTQALLKNQALKPSPGTMVDPVMAARLLRAPIAGPIANQPQQ